MCLDFWYYKNMNVVLLDEVFKENKEQNKINKKKIEKFIVYFSFSVILVLGRN